MIKNIIIIIFVAVSGILSAQEIKLVTLGFIQNFDLWKPYNFLNDGSDLHPKHTGYTFTAFAQLTLLNRDHWVLKIGPAYKLISDKVDNRLKGFNVTKYPPGGGAPYTVYGEVNMDYLSKSSNLGLQFVIERKFTIPKLLTVGLSLEGYCFEFYKAEYSNPKPQGDVDLPQYYPSLMGNEINTFHLSNVNGSVFCSYHIINTPAFSTAVKLNLGMNAYSAWDHYSRYGWIGIGLEAGFGKAKSRNKTNG